MHNLNEDELLNLKPMTHERLRTFEGFENIKKEKADELIKTMEHFCEILYTHITQSEE